MLQVILNSWGNLQLFIDKKLQDIFSYFMILNRYGCRIIFRDEIAKDFYIFLFFLRDEWSCQEKKYCSSILYII